MFSSTSSIKPTPDTLQALLNAIPNPLFLIDREHRLVMANDAFCEMVGYSRAEMVDNADYQVPEEQKAEYFRVDDLVFSTGQPYENEELTTTANGDVRILLTRKRLIHLPTTEGEKPFILASTTDVTRFREAQEQAQHLADHDALTGLVNRKRLADCLAETVQAMQRPVKPAALIMIDLDKFKTINDELGHIAGDQVLQIAAKRMGALVRSGDIVARLGGDEFCVIQPDGEQPAGAIALAERLLASFAQPIMIGDQHVIVGASIGIAIFPDDGDTPEALMHRADQALYEVKRRGRGDYLRYDVDCTALPPGR